MENKKSNYAFNESKSLYLKCPNLYYCYSIRHQLKCVDLATKYTKLIQSIHFYKSDIIKLKKIHLHYYHLLVCELRENIRNNILCSGIIILIFLF